MVKSSVPLRRAQQLGLVALGGAVGTVARYALTELIPNAGGFPTAVAAINVGGAFVLGWVLSAIAAAGAETPERTAIRLFVGTGVLGGFTTYGTFIDDEDMLLGMANMAQTWVAFGLPTILLGIAAAWAGMMCGRVIHRPARRAAP